MSEVHQVAQDLAFVRSAVDRHDKQRPDLFGVYLAWAFYIVIGYTLLDQSPLWANRFFAVGWIPATIVSVVVQRRRRERGEVVDPTMARRAALHWGGGMVLAIGSAMGLAIVIPALRGPPSGQVVVVLIGMVYFLGGIYFDRRFLVLGPIMMLGGISIGFIPAYPWTLLGLVIAAGLVVPSLFKRKADRPSSEVTHVEP